jgi:tetratricopeptide (TPR) repeat protein
MPAAVTFGPFRFDPDAGRLWSGSEELRLTPKAAGDRAVEWATRALELYPDDEGALINGACLHAKLGHKEEALALLERVFARGRGKRDWVEQDRDYDILRDDPRFQAMLARLK